MTTRGPAASKSKAGPGSLSAAATSRHLQGGQAGGQRRSGEETLDSDSSDDDVRPERRSPAGKYVAKDAGGAVNNCSLPPCYKVSVLSVISVRIRSCASCIIASVYLMAHYVP